MSGWSLASDGVGSASALSTFVVSARSRFFD
jgi:hypothetical protein